MVTAAVAGVGWLSLSAKQDVNVELSSLSGFEGFPLVAVAVRVNC